VYLKRKLLYIQCYGWLAEKTIAVKHGELPLLQAISPSGFRKYENFWLGL
jgi:hypothetical protein